MSTLFVVILLVFILPFAFYYLGVLIRSIVFPNKKLSLGKRLLVAIITSFLIITPLISQIYGQVKTVYENYNLSKTEALKNGADEGLMNAAVGYAPAADPALDALIAFLAQYFQYIFLCLAGGFFVDEGMHSLIQRRASFIGNKQPTIPKE